MDKETDLLDKRDALIAESKEAIREAAADGSTDPIATEPGIRKMLDTAEELREAATEIKVDKRVAAEREAADALAAQVIADAPSTSTEPLPQTLTERLRSSVRARESLEVEINLSRVAEFRAAAKSGVSAQDILSAQRSGDPQQLRALNITTDNKGGVLVPDTLESNIYDGLRTIQGVRAAGAEVVSTMSGAAIEYPVILNAYQPTGTFESAESSTITDTEDTYGSITLEAYKYTSQIALSRELIEDNGTNLNEIVGRRLGEVVAVKEENRFTLGTGTNMPKGIAHGVAAGNTTTSAFTSGTTTAPTYAELTTALGSLDPAYIARGVRWMMNSDTYYRIVASLDADSRPIHQARTTERPFDTFLGHPITINNYMDTYGASKNLIIVGDIMSAYIIREVGSFEVATSTEARFFQQEVVIQGTHRADGKIRDATAFRLIKTGS